MNDKLTVRSPVDGGLYRTLEYAGSACIESALTLAVAAQANWKNTPISDRVALCHRMVDHLMACQQEIASEICWQMGRPIRYAGGELDGLKERAHYMSSIAQSSLAPINLPEKPGFKRHIERVPVGVVLVIAPWNYPFLTAVNAIVPAILAGNTVVLKHSAQTPLCAERFGQAFLEAGFPEGVFQFLHLRHTDTESVIRDSRINQVCFTGSVAGGAMVEKAASGRFIGVGLELGGKDPAYIRHDADLEYAVATTVDGAFFNSGQSCCGIERIYVHEDLHDAFVEQVVALVKQYRLGRPDDEHTTLGPMVRPDAANFVRRQVDEAIAAGATPLIESSLFAAAEEGSAYLAPQVLTGVTHDMRIMTEETFGPAVGIQKVSSDEAAIELMNDSLFGLTASVFTQDIEAGAMIGEQIDTGTFFVNRCDHLDPALAWTGVGDSGKGCTLSSMGFEQLTRPKSFHMKIHPLAGVKVDG